MQKASPKTVRVGTPAVNEIKVKNRFRATGGREKCGPEKGQNQEIKQSLEPEDYDEQGVSHR